MANAPLKTVVGIDGGGTGTRAMLATLDGAVLGIGSAGPSNLLTQGTDRAAEQVVLAVRNAWEAARRPFAAASSAFVGVAGTRAAGTGPSLADALVQAGIVDCGHCTVGSDYENVLAGALGGRPGIALLAGTGSYCVARDDSGRFADCGGWGWLLDDIGGGTFLGKQALRAVVGEADGRYQATSLTPRILAALGVSAPRALPAAIQSAPSIPTLLASLAPLVLDEARAGDPVAKIILEQGADGLAALVGRVAAASRWPESPLCVITGGLGRSGEPYQALIERAITRAVPGVHLEAPALSNVAGAVLLALKSAGAAPGATLIRRLADESARLGIH